MNDLISRQQAIDRINGTGYADQIKDNLMLILRELPSAEPQERKGEWILHTYIPHHKYCSCCNADSPYNKRWKFCPNCGERMEAGA